MSILNSSPRDSISILLKFGNPPNMDSELIPGIPSSCIKLNPTSGILIFPIICYLKNIGYNLENTKIWYYSHNLNSKIFCGFDPLCQTSAIPAYEIEDNTITLICIYSIIKEREVNHTSCGYISQGLSDEEITQNPKNSNSRKMKEQKIGFVIDKVAKWRRFYKTKKLQNKIQNNRTDLEEAEYEVEISRKSLEDCLVQIRFAQKFGFNFAQHQDDKFLILRAYVKKCKKLKVFMSQIDSNEAISVEIIKELRELGTPSCIHNKCCVPKFALKFKNADYLLN